MWGARVNDGIKKKPEVVVGFLDTSDALRSHPFVCMYAIFWVITPQKVAVVHVVRVTLCKFSHYVEASPPMRTGIGVTENGKQTHVFCF